MQRNSGFISEIESPKAYGMIRFTFVGKILPLGWNQHKTKKLRTESLGIPFLRDKEKGLRTDRTARREWSQQLRKKGISESDFYKQVLPMKNKYI